jgi:hypothetical protein
VNNMTEEHAKKITTRIRNGNGIPGRMSPKAIRGAINKALKDLGSKTLKFTAPQRLKIYGMIEGWRLELKLVELESLQAEEIEEAPAQSPAPGTSTVDPRSPFFEEFSK